MYKSIFFTISGVSTDNIYFGLDEKNTDCIALKLLLLSKIADLNFNGVTDFVCNKFSISDKSKLLQWEA